MPAILFLLKNWLIAKIIFFMKSTFSLPFNQNYTQNPLRYPQERISLHPLSG
nr:MAG TPA: hypothetical protein [Caudoviricetes sp.]